MMTSSRDIPTKRTPPHRELLRRHRAHWGNSFALRASFLAIVAFSASLLIEYYAIAYATASVSNPATDIILSNIPAFDVNDLYVYGLMLLTGFITFLCLTHPKRVPFVLFSLALFVVIRSFFNSLTHLAPYPIPFAPDFGTTITKVFFGGDLFFSGHTGVPFLMGLLFWRETVLRYFFLLCSAFFAVVVLLGHLHYSIDVAAAFFITYTIYAIARWLFPRSHALFISDPIAEH